MEFFRRADRKPSRLGVFPGTFNPVTVAHLALAQATLPWVDEVVFVLPRTLPHKEYTGATFAQRVAMLQAAADPGSPFSIAATDAGLFVEIAEECSAAYGESVKLTFLCGRDAAERIATWDYGRPGALAEMLRGFDLLVAPRGGEYCPPAEFREAFRPLALPAGFDPVSGSEVRERVASGRPWRRLVPEAVHEQVRRIYAGNEPDIHRDTRLS